MTTIFLTVRLILHVAGSRTGNLNRVTAHVRCCRGDNLAASRARVLGLGVIPGTSTLADSLYTSEAQK